MEINIYHEIIIDVKLSPKKVSLKYSIILVKHEVPSRHVLHHYTPNCSLNISKHTKEYRLIGKSVGEYYGHLTFKSTNVWKSDWIECTKTSLADTLIAFLVKHKSFELFDPIYAALKKQFKVNLIEIVDPPWIKQLLRYNINKKEIIKIEKNIIMIGQDSEENKERFTSSKKTFKTQKLNLKTTESKTGSWWRQKKVDKINDLLPEINSNVLYYKKVAGIKSSKLEIEKNKLNIANMKQKDLIAQIKSGNAKVFLDDKIKKNSDIENHEKIIEAVDSNNESKSRKRKTVKLQPTEKLEVQTKSKTVKLQPTEKLDVQTKSKTTKLHPTQKLEDQTKSKTTKLHPTQKLETNTKNKTTKLRPTKKLIISQERETVSLLKSTKKLESTHAKKKTKKLKELSINA